MFNFAAKVTKTIHTTKQNENFFIKNSSFCYFLPIFTCKCFFFRLFLLINVPYALFLLPDCRHKYTYFILQFQIFSLFFLIKLHFCPFSTTIPLLFCLFSCHSVIFMAYVLVGLTARIPAACRDFTLCKSLRPTSVLADFKVIRFVVEKNLNS